MSAAGGQAAEEVADAAGDGRAEREEDRGHAGGSVADGPRRGDGVELVRVVEHGRLGRAGGAAVVVAGDRVQQLRAHCGIERRRRAPRSAAGRGGRGRAAGPPRSAGTPAPRPSSRVRPTSWSERGREQQVGAQARVELRGLAAERRDADRVLEQAARVGVVRLGGRERAERGASCESSDEAAHDRRASPACEISAARNSRKPSSSSASRRSLGVELAGIGVGRLERAHVELEPVAEARRGRARAPRRPRRSGRRAARRRSRPAPRSGRSGRRARARGTARPSSSAAAACARPRRRPRRRGPRRARRCCSRASLGA